MRKVLSRFGLAVFTLLAWVSAQAEVVHVRHVTLAGGVESVIADETLNTGSDCQSSSAPSIAGYIFTHWSISANQQFVNRDDFGRALDAVRFRLYEATTLTANYVEADRDSDNDGVADGYELYWYGTLDVNSQTDSDGDGRGFAEELEFASNPHFADGFQAGEVVHGDGPLALFNPHGYAQYVFKCDPEGGMFETMTGYVTPGTTLTTPGYDPQRFAYWKVGEGVSASAQDGVSSWSVKRDAMGRAIDSFDFVMPSNYIEVVAVCASDPEVRQKLYWYGTTDISMSSDTDGDGFTFAQEIANGTNPLFADGFQSGEVVYGDGSLLQFNPYNLQPYTIRSEPEGQLFATVSDLVRPGTEISTGSYGVNSGFAYWTYNGETKRDAIGRAIDSLTFVMPTSRVEVVAVCVNDADERAQLYWYGETMPMTSDTDGDGFTFSEELANGTNPLFADGYQTGEVVYGDGSLVEVNRQPYERVVGFVVDGKLTSFEFDNAVIPVVADINGDGLFDIILVLESGNQIYVNVGTRGNPEFVRNDASDISAVDLGMNSTAKLENMNTDVRPINALSASTNATTLLVSDTEGRIWYYRQETETSAMWALQHKVWGGSCAGFANGLMLAAVDWDDDGDLDCLCGTAEGKLMLLRDPKVGRPTNLKADAGADNVLLTWDPNVQSRVRGYKVYRAVGESTEYGVRGTPTLPTYRDEGLAAGTYGYKVSALSRFYTAGNSTPTVTESVTTEPVTATVGGPIITIGDPVKMPDGTVQIVISINNSMNYQAAETSIAVPYDAVNLAYQKTLPSGISEKLDYKTTTAGGVATIAITSGEVAPGSGTFFTLVFYGLIDGVLMGDLDGDGDVDEDDLRILIRASSLSGRKYTDYQLKAGDFNHNGKLDNGDVQSLRSILKGENQL